MQQAVLSAASASEHARLGIVDVAIAMASPSAAAQNRFAFLAALRPRNAMTPTTTTTSRKTHLRMRKSEEKKDAPGTPRLGGGEFCEGKVCQCDLVAIAWRTGARLKRRRRGKPL